MHFESIFSAIKELLGEKATEQVLKRSEGKQVKRAGRVKVGSDLEVITNIQTNKCQNYNWFYE